MVQYVIDLMTLQSKAPENSISLIYPGERSILPVSWIRSNVKFHKINVFEIVNALDVAIYDGIRDPKRILTPYAKISDTAIQKFFATTNPDILHIHTLLGIPNHFVKIAKQLGIRIVYSTHDYYGLCLRTSFIKDDGNVCQGASPAACEACCRNSPKPVVLYLRSKQIFYRYRKYMEFAKRFLPKRHPSSTISSGPLLAERSVEKIHQYANLLEHYFKLFLAIDAIHFNSVCTQRRYFQVLPNISGKILGITNAEINDNRVSRNVTNGFIRIGYMGGESRVKGLQVLLDATNELAMEGISNWNLILWGQANLPPQNNPSISLAGFFARNQIADVFNSMDILVVPSIGPETFGLVVLEALSYGIPVLLSEYVGAKAIVEDIDPSFSYIDGKTGLKSALKKICREPQLLNEFNRILLKQTFEYDMHNHSLEIQKLYTTEVAPAFKKS